MNEEEQRLFLIKAFREEQSEYSKRTIPEDTVGQRMLLRAILNTRMPGLPSREILEVQDSYLRLRISQAGITKVSDLTPMEPHLYLWKGDITTLATDAIVNAANSGMTGCWAPNHMCIDNAIHTFAGVQLRYECAQLMVQQGFEEPTGRAKITQAYNLPSKYVIHTVGPISRGYPTKQQCNLLKNCYRECYKLAKERGLSSLAYCCISTGVFGFPQPEASQIAVETIRELQVQDDNPIDVVFNVFSQYDYDLYDYLLG